MSIPYVTEIDPKYGEVVQVTANTELLSCIELYFSLIVLDSLVWSRDPG